MHITCIIFDFDGTLADTEEHTFRIYNTLAKKHNLKEITIEELPEIKHLNFMELLKFIEVPYHKLPKIMKEGQKLLRGDIGDIYPFEENLRGIIEDIRKKVKYMGIITSNTKNNVAKFLANNNIESFDFIISSPILSKEKKINGIAKKYSLEKDGILYIGDETRDIQACKKANIKCGAVTWGYNSERALKKEDPDYIIHNMQELMDIIE